MPIFIFCGIKKEKKFYISNLWRYGILFDFPFYIALLLISFHSVCKIFEISCLICFAFVDLWWKKMTQFQRSNLSKRCSISMHWQLTKENYKNKMVVQTTCLLACLLFRSFCTSISIACLQNMIRLREKKSHFCYFYILQRKKSKIYSHILINSKKVAVLISWMCVLRYFYFTLN